MNKASFRHFQNKSIFILVKKTSLIGFDWLHQFHLPYAHEKDRETVQIAQTCKLWRGDPTYDLPSNPTMLNYQSSIKVGDKLETNICAWLIFYLGEKIKGSHP